MSQAVATQQQKLIGRYRPYPEYKDSGVIWSGFIPSHWEPIRFKHVFVEKPKTSNIELPAGSISFGQVVFKDEEKLAEETKASYQEVKVGEFLVNPLNLNFDLKSLRTALSEIDVVVSTGYIVLQCYRQLEARYARWLLHEFDVAHMKSLGAGVRQTIGFNDIGNSYFCMPRLEEQLTIAAFLDYETARIDRLIAQQQRLIELLKEKRQAVISHAVTKGLNPNAPMKDSGVEWLGQVPEHWSVVKLSYVLSLKSGDGITSNEIEPEGTYPVYGGNGLRGYCEQFNCNGTYALIGRQGALCGNVNVADGKFFASEHAVVVYPRIQFDVRFLSEFLRFMDLGQYSVSAAQPGISVERINMLSIAVPPIEEQSLIGQRISQVELQIERLVVKAEAGVLLLKERRTALISAAVTGKIDLRGWTQPAEEVAA
ncbi:restriction endonuclease subunit S [Aeromonas veronii]